VGKGGEEWGRERLLKVGAQALSPQHDASSDPLEPRRVFQLATFLCKKLGQGREGRGRGREGERDYAASFFHSFLSFMPHNLTLSFYFA